MIRFFIPTAVALSLSLSATAATPAAVSPAEKVRKAIDNICGDTWCEGDFQFKFNRVSFNKKNVQTTVYFTMNPYPSDEVVADTEASSSIIAKSSFNVKCVIKGYADAALIVDDNGSLNDGFYTAVSACVNSLEDEINTRL